VQARRRTVLVALGFATAGALAFVKYALDHASRSHLPASGVRPLWHVVAAGSASMQGRPVGYVVTLELVWLFIAAGATWLGVTRGRSMLGRSAASKVAVATLTPVALIVTWVVVALAWLESVIASAWLEAMDDAPDVHFHTACAVMSIVYALGPLVAFLAIRRSKDPVSPRRAGAAIGAVAGAWGAVVHFPFCECTSPLHVALGHVLPVVVLAVAGAMAGDRVLGVRPTPLGAPASGA
jgi:hypothetical protein